MRKLILVGTIALILVLAGLLAGCQPGTTVTVTTTTTTIATTTQTAVATVTATATVTDTAAVSDLQQQLDAANAELATLRLQGATKADTVTNIARYYNQTHTYTATDMFVCGDMASEIWNMLKTFGISSQLVVGSVDHNVSDILQSSHAWIIAEVEPNSYLAVECTGGYTVPMSQNALYYQGWYYNNPETLKQYFDDVKEYNTRIEMHNQLVVEQNAAAAAYNSGGSASQLAIANKLSDIIHSMEDTLQQLSVSINTAATVLNVSQ
jgi:hypothetical protein